MYWTNFTVIRKFNQRNSYFVLGTNVALRKPATQSNDVNYAGWIWTADYAVDGCTDRDQPDSQYCCSTSIPKEQETENKWSVDLLGPYVIDRIIIFGRSGRICVQ